MKTGKAVALVILMLFVDVTAHAGPLTLLAFNESDTKHKVAVGGKVIGAFDTHHLVFGVLWKVVIDITEDQVGGNDFLKIEGQAQHIVGVNGHVN